MRTRSFDPSDFEEFFDAKELENMMNGMHITRFGEYRDDDTEEYKQTGTRKRKKNSKQAMETLNKWVQEYLDTKQSGGA